jgi:hypothetical protein
MAVVAAKPRRSRLRVSLAVIGGLLSLVFIGIGALLLLDLAARHTSATTTRYADVRSLIVQSGAGDVSLTSAPAGGAVVVKTSKTESLFKPNVRSRLSDDRTLTLTASCPSQLGTTAGDIDAVRLDAPDITLSTGLGGLRAVLTKPARRLSASTVAGGLNLMVPDVTYALHASSGVGHVSDGTVRIDLAAPRTITARSSLGDILIAVAG